MNVRSELKREQPCPLCGAEAGLFVVTSGKLGRPFHRCPVCALVFVPPEFRPSPEEERERYEQHHNSPDSVEYRRFLSRLFEPLLPLLSPGAEGLDYGAGPGPTLSRMFEEAGFRMSIYDPFFAPDTTVLTRAYDFVTCTEAAEHFHHPARELATLSTLLRPGGWLGLMTEMLESPERFAGWHYHRDPTHVCFYSEETMRWLAARFDWECRLPRPNVVIFRSRATGAETPA